MMHLDVVRDLSAGPATTELGESWGEGTARRREY